MAIELKKLQKTNDVPDWFTPIMNTLNMFMEDVYIELRSRTTNKVSKLLATLPVILEIGQVKSITAISWDNITSPVAQISFKSNVNRCTITSVKLADNSELTSLNPNQSIKVDVQYG